MMRLVILLVLIICSFGQRYDINEVDITFPFIKPLFTKILNEQYNMIAFKTKIKIDIRTTKIGPSYGYYRSNFITIYVSNHRNDDEIVYVFHHELMHHIRKIYPNMLSLSKFAENNNYVKEKYKTEARCNGFVSNYAMYNLEEDIAETYSEYMTGHNLRSHNVIYDDIILRKFELIEEYLSQYKILNRDQLVCLCDI